MYCISFRTHSIDNALKTIAARIVVSSRSVYILGSVLMINFLLSDLALRHPFPRVISHFMVKHFPAHEWESGERISGQTGQSTCCTSSDGDT